MDVAKNDQAPHATGQGKKGVQPPAPEPYEPPKLTKFEKLEKLIVSGE
jgi:hypothetical protein